MFDVQSVLFDKRFFMLEDAVEYAYDHGYKVKKIDETDNYFRFRQFAPKDDYSYVTRDMHNGVKLIVVVDK